MNDLNYDIRFKAIQRKHKVLKGKIESEYYYSDLKPRIQAKTAIKKDIDGKAICDICGKTLKNEKGVKIHKGKVHKTNNQETLEQIRNRITDEIASKNTIMESIGLKQKPSLSFDDNGKYVNGKINKVIRDYPKQKTKKLDQEKREFWCSKHKRFHKHRFHGNISKTYQKCLRNKENFYKFKINMSQYEIYTLKIPKAVKRYSIESHKRTTGSRKQ